MCGIAIIIVSEEVRKSVTFLENKQKLLLLLQHRGPDSYGSLVDVVDGHHPNESLALTFMSAVLHIQGEVVGSQPIIDNGDIFCWNGEVFGGLAINHHESDTIQVLKLLNEDVLERDVDNHIISVLSKIWGPYSFIFYNLKRKCVYYGRDPFGRRSLISYLDACNGSLIISSVSHDSKNNTIIDSDAEDVDTTPDLSDWTEVDTRGIYKILLSGGTNSSLSPTLIPWPTTRLSLERPMSSEYCPMINRSALAERFLQMLQSAITRRLMSLYEFGCDSALEDGLYYCNVGVLFSGGIDSVLLAAVLARSCLEHANTSSRLCIDLINISFYDSQADDYVVGNPCHGSLSPDRLAAIVAVTELQQLYPNITWNLVHIDIPSPERLQHEPHIKQLIYPCNTHMDLNIGTAFWFATRGIGYLRKYDTMEVNQMLEVTYAGTSRPLLRVGEEGAACAVGVKRDKRSSTSKEPCANRDIDGCMLKSKDGCGWNLCKRCCIAKQTSDSTSRCRVHRLKSLVPDQPSNHKAEDDNESTPLTPLAFKPYTSHCKCFLVGIGADEQMAGYGRHRTTYQRGGIVSLEEELNMDMRRLWQRNLGRDDRCISDNGVEAWFPFLDEEVVGFLHDLHINQICDLSDGQGSGDKRILRDAAAQLGLSSNCHQLVKRAIQFGTRIAKQTNSFYHGSHRKGKGSTLL